MKMHYNIIIPLNIISAIQLRPARHRPKSDVVLIAYNDLNQRNVAMRMDFVHFSRHDRRYENIDATIIRLRLVPVPLYSITDKYFVSILAFSVTVWQRS